MCFAIHRDNEPIPFPERVQANFNAWVEAASRRLKRQDGASTGFTDEQMHWLEMIRDYIAANPGIEPDDWNAAPMGVAAKVVHHARQPLFPGTSGGGGRSCGHVGGSRF